MMLFGSQLKADTMNEDIFARDADEPSALVEQGWNRWSCTARAFRSFRIFRGHSYYFQQQSGEGQQAKRVAQLMALRNCEFHSRFSCQSRLESCTVQRF